MLLEVEHEVFSALFLDTQHRLIRFEERFRGTIDSASVYPRKVVKRALVHNAAAEIFVHNHPLGDPEPSDADRRITERLNEALGLVEVPVIDHIMVGSEGCTSFSEVGVHIGDIQLYGIQPVAALRGSTGILSHFFSSRGALQ